MIKVQKFEILALILILTYDDSMYPDRKQIVIY